MQASRGRVAVWYMQQRFITHKAAVVHTCNRFPWNVSRGIGRYVFGKVDHRDATVMAQAEPSVRTACGDTFSKSKRLPAVYKKLVGACMPHRSVSLRLWQVLSDVNNGIATVTLNRWTCKLWVALFSCFVLYGPLIARMAFVLLR